jgi:hypothetical protein
MKPAQPVNKILLIKFNDYWQSRSDTSRAGVTATP